MSCGLRLSLGVLLAFAAVDHRPALAQEATRAAPAAPRAEVDRFLEMRDYRGLKRLVAHWSKDLTPDDRKGLVVELSSRLMGTREATLENYADMSVVSRVASGRMEFPGHGEIISQDVFLENGRCAWAIEQLLKCRLATISVELNEKPDALAASVRKSLLKIIEAMAFPEGAKGAGTP